MIGTTRLSSDGSITFIPSTAESTEIAGVIMLSPKKSAAPKTPRPANRNLVRRADAISDLPDLRDQRHDPALALVVGPHHQQHVLER